jgi:hypothetical protein
MAYSGSPEDKLALFLGASGVIVLGGIVIFALYSSIKWLLKKIAVFGKRKET